MAEDVTHDVFVRVIRGLETYDRRLRAASVLEPRAREVPPQRIERQGDALALLGVRLDRNAVAVPSQS